MLALPPSGLLPKWRNGSGFFQAATWSRATKRWKNSALYRKLMPFRLWKKSRLTSGRAAIYRLCTPCRSVWRLSQALDAMPGSGGNGVARPPCGVFEECCGARGSVGSLETAAATRFSADAARWTDNADRIKVPNNQGRGRRGQLLAFPVSSGCDGRCIERYVARRHAARPALVDRFDVGRERSTDECGSCMAKSSRAKASD